MPATITLCGVTYTVSFDKDAPSLTLTPATSSGSAVEGRLECCGCNYAIFAFGGLPICTGERDEANKGCGNLLRLRVELDCCPLDGWAGAGWYCVKAAGVDGSPASSGPLYPGTAESASNSTVNDVAWDHLDNIKSAGGSWADTGDMTGEDSGELRATNFGFAIPAGATINGILVSVGRCDSSGNEAMFDKTVRLRTASGAVGDDKADLVTFWHTCETAGFVEKTYGGSSDTWGRTWTAEEVNGTDFGVSLVCTGESSFNPRIDWVRVTVHYTAAACVAVELLDADKCDTGIEICSGPYATEEEAVAVCSDAPVAVCAMPSLCSIPRILCLEITRATTNYSCDVTGNVPLVYAGSTSSGGLNFHVWSGTSRVNGQNVYWDLVVSDDAPGGTICTYSIQMTTRPPADRDGGSTCYLKAPASVSCDPFELTGTVRAVDLHCLDITGCCPCESGATGTWDELALRIVPFTGSRCEG